MGGLGAKKCPEKATTDEGGASTNWVSGGGQAESDPEASEDKNKRGGDSNGLIHNFLQFWPPLGMTTIMIPITMIGRPIRFPGSEKKETIAAPKTAITIPAIFIIRRLL